MNSFFPLAPRSKRSEIEPLEQRIAPALVGFTSLVNGTGLLLEAGTDHAGLATSQSGGAYLLYVEKGSAFVFTTDLNDNGQVDFNEITGIAAGDGLRLISFVNIHGNIVTNLKADGTLTDSDNSATNGRDGRIVLNNQIEKITMRSLTQADLPATDVLDDRLALSSYSIFGNIYAGKGVGVADGGVILDTSGKSLQAVKFTGGTGISRYVESVPMIGSIKVGTAVSGELFSFGTSAQGAGAGFQGEDVQGELVRFVPATNADGGDIINVRASNPNTLFNLGTLQAGDGGFNGRGGNVVNVEVTGDTAGGYRIIAGNAGDGPVGKPGGSIVNFSDLGSNTSEVLFQTGNGGRGLTGPGGAAGLLTFDATPGQGLIVDLNGDGIGDDADGDGVPDQVTLAGAFNIAGRLIVNLGNGGDGFTNGAAGGGLPSGTFAAPEVVPPVPLNVVSSTHSPGDIYNTRTSGEPATRDGAIRGFDFDGDGANDLVYTTRLPSQLAVLFGELDPTGTNFVGIDEEGTRYPGASGTIYLNAPANPEALVVADLNGDGRPDIATASNDPSFAGVAVFLSRYDAQGKLLGFRDPIYNPLPHLADLENNPLNPFGNLGFSQQAVAIQGLTSGDFDGDGIVDLALTTIQSSLGLPTAEGNVVMIMRGDAKDADFNAATPDVATGYFFADFTGLRIAQDEGTISDNVFGDTARVQLKASTAAAPAVPGPGVPPPRDLLFGGEVAEDAIYVYRYAGSTLAFQRLDLGKVDTNRNVSDPGKRDKISLQDAFLQDFTLFDLDGDDNADIAALTSTPGGFLVTFRGNGAGGFTIASNDPSDDTAGRDGENTGIDLVDNAPEGLELGGGLVGILTTNANNTPAGRANDLTIVDYDVDGFGPYFVELSLTNFFTASVAGTDTATTYSPVDSNILAFDTYRPLESNVAQVGYGFGDPIQSPAFDFIEITAGTGAIDFAESARRGFFITAGDGGDGQTGVGGAGGQLGKTFAIAGGTGAGSLNIIVPDARAFTPELGPTVTLDGGNGGNGYLNGGAGGSISGVSVVQATEGGGFSNDVRMTAGRGGNSVTKTGGEGGSLSRFSILGGSVFTAGAGGRGVFGGDGGDVLGSKLAGFVDAKSNAVNGVVLVEGGVGGLGLKRGGGGGDIRDFTPDFPPLVSGEGGFLRYIAGAGGHALSGPGGLGGSVVNANPAQTDNNLVGDIQIRGGNGGDGLSGARGGSVISFVNSPGQGSIPPSASVLAGNGGRGTSGNGGAGGDIIGVNITARGTGTLYEGTFENPTLSPVLFNRYIAGQGGDSFGATGGAGGSLINVTGIATTSSFAVASGKGGDGLLRGGAGGNVVNALINASAAGKILVIAGEGGDAYAAVTSADDPLAPGGVNGTGGNGGSINGFSQPVGELTHVDLIAGNGGSTINHGSSLDLKTKAGRGGSISNVTVAGNIGNTTVDDPNTPVNENAPIKAYNQIRDPLTGEFIPILPGIGRPQKVADFVQNFLIDTPGVFLDDSIGNVGIVVGATGRVKDNNGDNLLDPASVGINGSLINVKANNIMSAVADSVDRLASIQAIVNVRTTVTGGVFGADKNVDAEGDLTSPDGVPYTIGSQPANRDYLTTDNTWVNEPVLGGRLVDGAIIGKNQRLLKSIRDFVRR